VYKRVGKTALLKKAWVLGDPNTLLLYHACKKKSIENRKKSGKFQKFQMEKERKMGAEHFAEHKYSKDHYLLAPLHA